MLFVIAALVSVSALDVYVSADGAYASCVAKQALRLDNGQDRASDIAEAAIEKCGTAQMKLWQAYYDYLVEQDSDWPRKQTNEYMEARYDRLRTIAIADILEKRARR